MSCGHNIRTTFKKGLLTLISQEQEDRWMVRETIYSG